MVDGATGDVIRTGEVSELVEMYSIVADDTFGCSLVSCWEKDDVPGVLLMDCGDLTEGIEDIVLIEN